MLVQACSFCAAVSVCAESNRTRLPSSVAIVMANEGSLLSAEAYSDSVSSAAEAPFTRSFLIASLAASIVS